MNTVKLYPEYGDIFFIDANGNKRFVGQDATSEFVNSIDAVGVVYDVNGREFSVVAGVNDHTERWSIACDFEITSIPSESGDYEVKLQNVVVGSFTYNLTDGTKAEFVEQLNEWLTTNAPKWEAYMEDENTAILQLSTYDAYESTCTISGCTLVKRVGSELASETINYNLNQVKQSFVCSGMCRARIEEIAKTSTHSNFNPNTRMNGTTQLFVQYPCSEIYYNGELGDGLRENYPTYEAYLDACMLRPKELNRGIMQYQDGIFTSQKLLNKKLLIRGVEKSVYSAVVWANEYDSGVSSYGAGTFHLPSMSELALLMRDITNGTSKPLDLINTSLKKRTGWTLITSTPNRWSSCRNSANYAWNYNIYGASNNSPFCYLFTVSAVAHFTLD